MTHKRVIKPGDIGAVDEVLGWDPRGASEEYEYVEKAQEAFSRIKKELSALRAANKQEKQKYAELSRMNESYVKQLHAAEFERCVLVRVYAAASEWLTRLGANGHRYTDGVPGELMDAVDAYEEFAKTTAKEQP